MIILKLLFIVHSQLNQTKEKKDNNMVIFGNLAFIIMIRDFY